MQASTSSSYDIIVRPMLPGDLEQIIQIHLESFTGFFLTFLGHDFLALLYTGILNDPDGIVLVAASDGQLEGFVAGVTHQRGFYGRLIKKRKWAFALATLGALFKRPAIVSRLARALKRPAEASQSAAEACLMSIAVRPEAEDRGIGKQLIEAFCQEMTERGVSAVCLTSDRDNNERVNRFYQKCGFSLSRTFVTPEGRAMNEYLLSLK